MSFYRKSVDHASGSYWRRLIVRPVARATLRQATSWARARPRRAELDRTPLTRDTESREEPAHRPLACSDDRLFAPWENRSAKHT
jgi:hypothetical protein